MSMPSLLLRIGPDSGASMDLIVKVKYEGTLRRFNIYIGEDGKPDISLNAMRYKICDLFKFNLNSEIIITYLDEDNDVINMVDEEDLLDAIRQRLNPLRLEVSLTCQEGVGAAMRPSSETSTHKTYAIPKGNDQTLNLGSTGPSKFTPRNFHKGVHCDGCGMSPIVGPRYASTIKDNYELCLACFCEMGNVNEFTKIADPCDPCENVLPKSPEGVQCHGFGMSPIVYPFYSSKFKMGSEDEYGSVGSEEVADCLEIAHSPALYKPLWINREGLAHPIKLFDTWSPYYSCSQRSDISSLQSSVGNMESQTPGILNCCFVEDVTVCDGALLAPGTHFTKIWRLRNTGTLPWPQHTQLVRTGGTDLGAGNNVKLEIQEQGCPLGQDFDAEVHFIAPMQPGQYVSYWRLMAPSGQEFGQQMWVLIQVVESSEEVFLPLNPKPVITIPAAPKSVLRTKHPAENTGSFQRKNKQRLFGVDISCNESVSPYPVKSPLTTKDTTGNAVSFQGQIQQKLHGVDVFDKDSDAKATLFNDSMNLDLSDQVKIPVSIIEQPREKASVVPVQGFDVPATMPDRASMFEQLREKTYGVTVQDSDVPTQLQGVSMDTTFMSSTVRGNSLFPLPVHNVSGGNLDVSVRDPSLGMSDTDSYSNIHTVDFKQVEDCLLDDIEAMGFNQRKLNTDVLRKNNYNLEKTLDALCIAAECDPIFEELEEQQGGTSVIDPSLVMSDTDSYRCIYTVDFKQVEKFLLDHIEAMGFDQRKLNTDILRKNNYDLWKTVDDLRTASEKWALMTWRETKEIGSTIMPV